MVTDLLGDLGPVRRTARASRFERPVKELTAFKAFAPPGCLPRRGPDYAASAPAASSRRSASSSPTRSSPARSPRTRSRSCARVNNTRPANVPNRTTGVPSASPTRPRTSAGITSLPRSPIVTLYVPLTISRYHRPQRNGTPVRLTSTVLAKPSCGADSCEAE